MWGGAEGRYELVTSVAVLDELGGGPAEHIAAWLDRVGGLPLLPVEPAVVEIVEASIRHRLMPAAPGSDALHLALASYHKCAFLVTGNCRHLANANKFGHLHHIHTRLGLLVPALVTPMELPGGVVE